MIQLVPLILRNVTRNRRRSLLTLASTAISLALLALLMAIYQSFFYGEDRSPSEALRLVCRHRVSLTQPLPSSYLEKIRAIDGVAEVTPFSWFQGVYKDPKNFFARFAVDPNKVFLVHPDWEMPADQIAAFEKQKTGCAVAEKIANDYGMKIGDRVTITGDIYPVNLELVVTGIFKCPLSAESLIFHQDYLRDLLPADSPTRDTVGTFLIIAKTKEDVPRIARAIDTANENSPYPTRTESEKEFSRSFLAFLGNIRLFLAAICAAVTFTILLVSANTVAMAVRERTREMAILRTLGYTPMEILGLVLGEALVIALVGGLLGLGIGFVLAKGLEQGGGMGVQGMRWQAASIVLGVAAVVGMFAALVPAIVTARKNIVESLRFTG